MVTNEYGKDRADLECFGSGAFFKSETKSAKCPECEKEFNLSRNGILRRHSQAEKTSKEEV